MDHIAADTRGKLEKKREFGRVPSQEAGVG